MSEALDYLLETRPEAMGHYFAFLKAAGGSLDPKTRAIISVLTKVPNRTERGFQQYVRRALASGVGAGEILDALIMAFPITGLSGLVWAVDCLLAMDLPEFSAEQLTDAAPRWRELGPVADLAEGAQLLTLDGRRVLVVREGDAVRCFATRCPHQGGEVAVSPESPDRAVCPRHGWAFRLTDGGCLLAGKPGLSSLDCQVETGVARVYT